MSSELVARKRGVGYIRVSQVGGRGDDLISPELQQFAIQTWADANGVEIVRWITELDRSGRNFTKRKVAEMVSEIKAGDYQYVVLWKWSRWGRNMRESQVYLGLTEAEGGIVRAATEDFDPDTTMGRFTRDQMLLIAQLQSDMMSDGWKEVHDKRRREGLPHTGAARFGYLTEKGKGFWPDPVYGPLLASMYERYLAGVSARRLAFELNTGGVTTARGNTWDDTAITKMMDNGFAAGLIREHSRPLPWDHPKRDTKRSIASYDVWREGNHQPVISMELWERYKRKRLQMGELPPRLRKAVHALSGVLRCGWEGCGARMQAVHGPILATGHRAISWGCSASRKKRAHGPNFISDTLAQEEILAWLQASAEGQPDVAEEARRLREARAIKGEVQAAEAEQLRLNKRRSRLADLYADGDLERDEYRQKRADVDAELERVATELEYARDRLDENGPDHVKEFGVLAEEWPRMDSGTRRDALLAVVRHFIVEPRVSRYGPAQPVRVRAVEKWRRVDEHGNAKTPQPAG